MTPLTLTLKGFAGIRSGLGIPEVTLDLIKTEGQLVALSGPNGAGKSTLLDNLHPYRLMPGRATSYSPGGFSFYDHVEGPTAAKVLDWTHDGVRYHSGCYWKQSGKARKAEAYLFVVDGDETKPYKASDGTVSDGKTDTYDRCVTDILGPPEVFFTAAFAAQGRAPLAAYGNADIKALMSEILGLDQLRDLAKQASEIAGTIEASAKDGSRDLEDAESKRAAAEDAKAREKAALDEVDAKKRERFQAETALDSARKDYSKTEAELSRAGEIEAERERITDSGKKLKALKEQTLEELRKEAMKRGEEIEGYLNALKKRGQSIDETIGHKRKQVSEGQLLLGRADEIRGAEKRLPEASKGLEEARSNLEKAQAQKEHRVDALRKVDKLESDKNQLETKEKNARASLADLVKRAGMIGNVPCQDQQKLVDACPLLANAREAQGEVELRKEQIADLEHEQSTLANTIAEAKKDLPEQVDLTPLRRAVELLEAEERELRDKAKDAPKLEMAEAAISEARKDIQALEAERSELAHSVDFATKARRELQDDYDNRRQSTEVRYDEQLQELRDQLNQLPKPDLETAKKAKSYLEAAEAAHKRAGEAYEQAVQAHARAQAEREAAEKAVPDVGKLKEDVARLQESASHWRLLSQALGPNGIVALSIDDAGPSISDIANKLLLECFGPRYTVAIRTQRETRNGVSLKEVFDVVVFDANDGTEKPFSAISGGQKVYVNEALTRAVAIFQAQASGRSYGTLFADESDGALDVEKKREFVKMKRKVLELGGYDREFFITHTPALLEAADAVIDVEELAKETPPWETVEPLAATGR